MKGRESGDESYLVALALLNGSVWAEMWKAIIKSDTDRSGFQAKEEIDQAFKEFFPVELKKVSFHLYYKRFESGFDENVINYKQLKDEVCAKAQHMK